MTRHCIICEKRPARKDGYCPNCASKIVSDSKAHETVQPAKFLTYRGFVIGLYPTGTGTYKPQLLQRDAEKLPKSRTINLDTYCDGFDRDQIKRFKATVLSLARA